MIRKTIARSLASHLQKLQDGMGKYALQASKSRMHQLRVDMKHVRAVFFLLEAVSGHHKAKDIHRLIRKMFSGAGLVRECQLEIAWMRMHKKPMLLRVTGSMHRLARANRAFSEGIPGNLRKLKKIGESGRKLLKKSRPHDIHRYFRGLFERVQRALHPGLPAAHWHELRKLVKRLLFAGRWLGEERELPASVGVFLGDLDALQKAIGGWHDLVMIEALMNRVSGPAGKSALAKREAQLALKKLAAELRKHHEEVTRLLSVMHTRWNPSGASVPV